MNSKIKKIINKKNKSKIVCLTAYSKNFAEEIDKYADITLVGDSLGSVLYNYNTTTIPINVFDSLTIDDDSPHAFNNITDIFKEVM